MNLNKYIDHTLLKPDATKEAITKLCSEAKEHSFASVCVNPTYVPLASKLLSKTSVKVCTVIGFPLGANLLATKICETKHALIEGADEIDMVINIGRLKNNDNDYVEKEISEIKKICGKKVLKVIIETCLLTDEEKIRACTLAKNAGADFVKTSTGFSTAGAKVEDIKLMRKTVGPEMGVKASGGVRTKADAQKMIEAGATRIGTSNSLEIIK